MMVSLEWNEREGRVSGQRAGFVQASRRTSQESCRDVIPSESDGEPCEFEKRRKVQSRLQVREAGRAVFRSRVATEIT
jgi:hypothetical protein